MQKNRNSKNSKLQKLFESSIDLDEIAMSLPNRVPMENTWNTWETLAEVDHLMRKSPGWVSYDWMSLKHQNVFKKQPRFTQRQRYLRRDGRSSKI